MPYDNMRIARQKVIKLIYLIKRKDLPIILAYDANALHIVWVALILMVGVSLTRLAGDRRSRGIK